MEDAEIDDGDEEEEEYGDETKEGGEEHKTFDPSKDESGRASTTS